MSNRAESTQPTEDLRSREGFSAQKRRYFAKLALGQVPAFNMHINEGLWKRNDKGERDWGNVSEHCLVEVARVDVLASALGLSDELKQDIRTAAALHDYFKKGEKETASKYDFSWEGFEEASKISTQQMAEAGFSDRVVHLANAVGHGSLVEANELLQKPDLDPEDLAFLAMHYVDDYTIGSDWVEDHGDPTEAFEARMIKNESNTRYARLNEEGREHFDGRTSFQAQREIGLAVQDRLAKEISRKTDEDIDPRQLPGLIDEDIKQRIVAA